jgi:hypothetical protein
VISDEELDEMIRLLVDSFRCGAEAARFGVVHCEFDVTTVSNTGGRSWYSATIYSWMSSVKIKPTPLVSSVLLWVNTFGSFYQNALL